MAARKKSSGGPKKRARREARSRAVPSASRSKLERSLAGIGEVLAGLESPSAVIGGIAVIAWGFARTTADIDCAIATPLSEAASVAEAFASRGFEPRITDAVAFALENHVLLLKDERTGIEVDVSFSLAGFEHDALRRAVTRDFGGVRVRIPTVTDLLIYKLIAGREQDTRDVVELLGLGHQVDAVRIEAVLSEIDAILETDRVSDWQRIRRSLA